MSPEAMNTSQGSRAGRDRRARREFLWCSHPGAPGGRALPSKSGALNLRVLTVALVVVSGSLLPAQDYLNNVPPPKAAPEVAVPLTAEQREALRALEVRIAGVEALVPKIDDAKYKAATVAAIADFRKRAAAQARNFDQGLYEALMHAVISRYQVVSLFLTPARIPDPAAAVKPVMSDKLTTADFTEKYCAGCHNDVDKEGGFDITALAFAPEDPANFQRWVKVYDRLQAGEMPPKEKKRPDPSDLEAFLGGLASSLTTHEQAASAEVGRAIRRRMNRAEYENSLRDLFAAPWLQIRDQLPEDGEAHGFNKVSTALDVSHVHMSRYMLAADYAMRQAISVKLTQPEPTVRRYYARDERSLTGFQPSINQNAGPPDRHKFPVLGTQAQPDVRAYKAPLTVGDADPATRELEAIGWTSSNYVTGFASGWGNFRAPVAGRYRLRFSGYTLWAGPGGHGTRFANGRDRTGTPRPPSWFYPNYDDISPGRRDEPITIYAKGGTQNRRLGQFDLTPPPTVNQLDEVWLLANEFIVTDASRFYRSRPTGFQGGYTNPLAQPDGTPAVAFRWMEVEGPLQDDSTTAGYRLLFGDLPLKKLESGTAGVAIDVPGAAGGRGGRFERGNRSGTSESYGGPSGQTGQGAPPALGASPRFTPFTKVMVDVVSDNPARDADRLLRAFMARAYRRAVEESDVQRFLSLIQERMKAGLGFAKAMLAGYTAVLASPKYVYLDEQPGPLDDHALATRLALFLTNAAPDGPLRARAARGELRRPEVLRTETDRLIDDARADRFVAAFLDHWIDLRKMEDTTPSTTLYNDYYLDDALTEAALDETRMFMAELIRRNLPARNIVDSNFTFLNERLAAHYGVPGVTGAAMRRVTLPPDSVRGGLMTQASVLKVTANGTTTSPVLRGKWITERILGLAMPPPPPVPAVEPDIRGAVTIRQQLDKHRADKSCASCHTKMDPPGFALESFDVMGAWRDRYRAISPDAAPERGFGKNGWPFVFHYALPVDCAGELPDGRPFRNVREFKRLLVGDELPIARNLARQLTVYATGAPVRFSDRPQIERMLEAARESGYGVRSLVHAVVQSDLFRTK
jgi:hypothetical protein